MYEAFDTFCGTPTWDTAHGADEVRFDTALAEVIYLPGFSPHAMGEYIRRNAVQPIWPTSAAKLDEAVDRLVERALR